MTCLVYGNYMCRFHLGLSTLVMINKSILYHQIIYPQYGQVSSG